MAWHNKEEFKRGPKVNKSRALFEDKRSGIAATLLPFQEAWYKKLRDRRQKIASMKREGKLTKDAYDQEVFEASQEYYLAAEKIRAEVDGEIEAARKKHESVQVEPAKQLLLIKRWETKYGSMDEKQLADAVIEYGNFPQARDPDEINILMNNVRARDRKDVGGLEAVMKKTNYAEPWLANVKPESTGLKKLMSSEFGQIRVLSPLGGMMDINVKELFNE